MLTGSELLAKVKELGDVSKSELVRECGYVSSKKNGSERLNFTAFYEALLGAKGVNLGTDSTGRGTGKGGRKLSYTTKIQFNGNLLAPSARKDDASPFRPFQPPGGLMEPTNASLQRGRQG